MLSRFHLIPERYGLTDGRTDRRTDLLYQYRDKKRLSTNVSFYLGNDRRYGHSYYGMRIGIRIQAFE